MRCKTKQREGSRPADPRVSSHHDACRRVGHLVPSKSELGEINDRRGLSNQTDRIRLIAIKT